MGCEASKTMIMRGHFKGDTLGLTSLKKIKVKKASKCGKVRTLGLTSLKKKDNARSL